ncbi:MAG: hypothetical protein FWF85_05555 [Clostridiales bacterium]|nr:hypothetical protein [Clostridiales bacterium]MDR2713618.1 hypothetical protein [Clostridiales bacterium]
MSGSEFFDNIFGSRKRAPNQGRDITLKVQISYDESIAGAKKEVSFSYSQDCSACNGTGSLSGATADICQNCGGKGKERVVTSSGFGKISQIRQCPVCQGTGKDLKDVCPKCSGIGFMKINKRITVNIPKNTENGRTLTFKDLGEPGEKGGPRGNLLVKVAVRPKYTF